MEILIPAKNIDFGLRDCVDSILSDEIFSPRDIIIVWDHGLNNPEARESIEQMGIKILVNCNAPGVAGALNSGLNFAKGNFIRRIDADDRWVTGSINAATTSLLQNDNNIVCARPINRSEKGRYYFSRVLELPEGKLNKYAFIPGNPITHPTVSYRKDTVRKVGAYLEDHFAEDLNLWLRCMIYGIDVFYLHHTSVVYQRSSMQVSQKLDPFLVAEQEYALWSELVGEELGLDRKFLEFALCRGVICCHELVDLVEFCSQVKISIGKLAIKDKSVLDDQTLLNIFMRLCIPMIKHVTVTKSIRFFYVASRTLVNLTCLYLLIFSRFKIRKKLKISRNRP